EVVWEASYRAWGEARETIARVSKAAGVEPRNPIRFQGQQEDAETGLRYNRYRYYDPGSGRFVSKDPIGLDGGINVYQYVPNPVEWIDPFGLSPRCRYSPTMNPLEKIAHSIHGESLQPGGSTRAFNSETIAVALLEHPSGDTQIVAASSRGRMSRVQRTKARVLGVSPVEMPNLSGPEGHAEVNIINRYAEVNGLTVKDIAASRPICCDCEISIRKHGANPVSPMKRKRK
ncbi:RHS repeat-associated core domain-containing protein, partial [Burkholderia cepacia]